MHRHMAAKYEGTEEGFARCSEGLKASGEVKGSRLSEP